MILLWHICIKIREIYIKMLIEIAYLHVMGLKI